MPNSVFSSHGKGKGGTGKRGLVSSLQIILILGECISLPNPYPNKGGEKSITLPAYLFL